MDIRKAQTSIEELNEVMEMVSDSFYTVVSFNRDKAIGGLVQPGMSTDQEKVIANAVNAGVRATLNSIEELDGEIRFKTRGCTAILSGDLCRGMFEEINT
ncbi:hypothetical protein FDI21_gp256 [Pseudomonas phage Noxifer]|uniref:Uncharacterized protein n=1 Tax=Pseudomonas phage Noxifer TaxID=2006684 RepID=A0A1Y0SY24_9CAUD|nr:hypothetical protein FDI21_gp256 [Pseudomonas phage Noxifer]ARV77455.1 hypothetical protein NOXIFER_290 [Pseudomonas phage Noxifer]